MEGIPCSSKCEMISKKSVITQELYEDRTSNGPTNERRTLIIRKSVYKSTTESKQLPDTRAMITFYKLYTLHTFRYLLPVVWISYAYSTKPEKYQKEVNPILQPIGLYSKLNDVSPKGLKTVLIQYKRCQSNYTRRVQNAVESITYYISYFTRKHTLYH